MQKGPQATFKGHVRRGFDNWKKGRVDFTVEADSGSWTVQLFHDVNPNRVVHRYKSLLGKSASIIFKCSRLIIGDKRDGELHIKIPDHEAVNAERLVKKITSYSVNTPNHNRAEVGLTSSRNGISSSDGNVSKVSNLPKTEGWLSKKTPPPSFQQKHHASSAKRKIQLDFTDQGACKSSNVSRAERQSRLVNGDCYVIDGDEDDEEVTFPHFTGMKDYSKSCKDAVVNNGKGLGPVNFYGADKSLMAENAYRGLNRKPASSNSPSQHNGLRSPKVKRPKLSDIDDADRENKIEVSASSKALLKGALCNRMAGKTPTLSDPQEVVVSGGSQNDEHAASLDASGHNGDGHMVGFDNLGNTCFMNSPLQCLSSLEPLSLDIQSAISKFGPQLPPNSITKMLYLLMKDVRKLDVRPERVREILTRLRHDINGKFEYNTQQDAHELLAELLDRTDEEVKALLSNTNGKVDSPTLSPNSPSTSVNANDENAENKEASKLLSTGDMLKSTPTEANFTWFYKTSFFFHECKTEVVSSQDERDTTLMLALDSKTSMNLQDCIDNYFESSEVDMRCEKCGKEEKATMTRKIVKRPRCFILNLLRYHTHNLEAKKKLDRVSIPRYMSVVEFCAEDVKAAPAIEPVFMLDRLPYDASLPVESANGAQMMYTPAVEAAKCGHAIALTKACEERRKIAVSESKRCTSPGQVETKAVETSDNLDTTREDVRKNGANGQAHDEKEQNLDPAEQERLTIKRLANHLADQFAEVEQHIEMAREAQEDFSDIYTEAQNTIVTMSGHVKNFMEQNYELEEGETRESNAYKMAEQNTLCEVLIERALVGDEESDEEFDYPRVRKRLIALRYRSVHGEAAQMNHLINDLAMYLAAKEVGVVVEPDTPKRQKMSCVGSSGGPYKGNSTLDHSCKCEKEVKRNSFDGEDKAECTSHGEVFMEEDSGNRGSIEVNLSGVNSRTSSAGDGESESWTKDKATQVGRENHNNRKGKSGVSEKNSLGGQKSQADSSKVETTEEESSGGLADVSHNATINTTNGFNSSMYDPGFLGDGMDKSLMDVPLLLGRPVSEWSEQELHDVELGALSEEDMMTYAQALSRLEYEREQINHTVSTSVASTAVIDSNTYSDIMDSCEEMTAVSYISTSSAQEKERLDCANKYPGEVSSTSGSSLSEGSDTERAASKLTSPEGKPNSNNKSGLHVDKGKTPSKLPELHCEESLSDIDEPDGMKDDSDVFKVKGLKGGQAGSNSCLSPSSSNTRSRSRLSSNERTCKSCGQVRNKNKHCSPCKASPTLSSMDSGKVLSPHKGLSNHANTLVQSNKTSRVQSSERNPQNPPHGNQSPRLQSISPAVSSLSSSSSGSGGGKSNLNSRDIHMLSPSMSQLSPRKDACSVSHSKSARNELARLRSPSSASPRKRLCKESGSASSQGGRAKLGSASKRLLFEDESGNNNRVQSHVKRTLASEDASTGLIDKRTSVANNLLENYPMQEDLIGGSLAKSEDGELADPDGIHKLLSASKSDKSSSSLLCQISSSKSKSGLDDDQTISIISNPSNIPHPVPVAGSRHNVANSVKMEPSSHSPSSKSQLTQILSPSTFREEGNQKQAVTLKSIMESAASGDEDYADGENADPVHTSTKPKSHRQQLSLNDEKENIVESGTRRERLDNIEMGKADCSYRLVGIVNHHGESLFAGHYTAFSFNFNKQRWFFMDDKHTRGTVETTARAESANSGYVFFYMDKDIFDKYAQKVSERPPKRGSTNC